MAYTFPLAILRSKALRQAECVPGQSREEPCNAEHLPSSPRKQPEEAQGYHKYELHSLWEVGQVWLVISENVDERMLQPVKVDGRAGLTAEMSE